MLIYDLILELLIVGSLGVAIVIIARALPRVESTTEENMGNNVSGKIDEVFKRIPFAAIDAAISGFLEKMLRKIRVLNLRINNMVDAGIKHLRGSKAQQDIVSKNAHDNLFEKK